MPNPKFDNLNVLKERKTKAKADKLADLISQELGVPVTRYIAIDMAVDTEIERVKKVLERRKEK